MENEIKREGPRQGPRAASRRGWRHRRAERKARHAELNPSERPARPERPMTKRLPRLQFVPHADAAGSARVALDELVGAKSE